jgi:hypothetical protein
VISARALLHGGALALPVGVALAWAMLMSFGDLRLGLRQALIFAVPAAIAAQIAALLRWSALERRAIANKPGWPAGIGMAAITHLLFGLLFALGLAVAVGLEHGFGESSWAQLLVQALFFTLASIGAVGMGTFFVTAVLAQKVAALRHKELALEPV